MFVCMWSNFNQTWHTYNYIYKIHVCVFVCMWSNLNQTWHTYNYIFIRVLYINKYKNINAQAAPGNQLEINK
jgi:hypothetical protein